MRFLSLAPILMTLWSSDVLSSPDDWRDAFPDDHHPRGVFKYEGSAPGGLVKGTYTPHNPGPMWKRAMVFAPSIRMVRVPLVALPVIAGAVPAYFSIKKYFGKVS